MERDFRGYSLVQYSTFLRFLVCSDPKPSHFIILFSAFSWATSARYWLRLCSSLSADIGKLSIQASLKRCIYSENLPIHMTISKLPLLCSKWSLNVFLKYLTPSVALRKARLSSPLYISASPTTRLFSAGPRFVSSSIVRSNQSSINSSYLNPGCWPV